MNENKEWREDQKALTREILEEVNIVSFSVSMTGVNKGCYMDHLDGAFGYLSIQDALDRNWRVFDYDSDALLGSYTTIEDLLNGGWKVST